jgi:hypothetical protein
MRRKQIIATAYDWIRKEKPVQQTFDEVLGRLSRNGVDNKRRRARRTRSRGSDRRSIRRLAESISQMIYFPSTRKLVQEDVEREIATALNSNRSTNQQSAAQRTSLPLFSIRSWINRPAGLRLRRVAQTSSVAPRFEPVRTQSESNCGRFMVSRKRSYGLSERLHEWLSFENKREKILASLWS